MNHHLYILLFLLVSANQLFSCQKKVRTTAANINKPTNIIDSKNPAQNEPKLDATTSSNSSPIDTSLVNTKLPESNVGTQAINQAPVAESEAAPVVTTATNLESTTPIHMGSAISFTDVTTTDLRVHWGAAASPNKSPLEYKLVMSTEQQTIDELQEVEQASGAAVLIDWSKDARGAHVQGLKMYTPYFFAVITRDQLGNKLLYPTQSKMTACGCPSGQYAANGSCIAAETGFYAAMCERKDCSNKPANAVYLGEGYNANSCAWGCDSGFVANSTFTSCEENKNLVPLSCGPEQVIVGFSGRFANTTDRFGVTCQTINKGKIQGPKYAGTDNRGAGRPDFSSNCPEGSAVAEIQWLNHAALEQSTSRGVKEFKYKCKNIETGSTTNWVNVISDTSYVSGKTKGKIAPETNGCGSPYFLNWLTLGAAQENFGMISSEIGCRSTANFADTIAHWSFENDLQNLSSKSGNQGKAKGHLKFDKVNKKHGKHAAKFDGTETVIDTEMSLLNGINEFSVSGWIYIDSRTGSDFVSFWGQKDLMELGFNNVGAANDVCLTVFGANTLCSNRELAIGKWQHIVATINASQSMKLYVNNQLVGESAITSAPTTSAHSFKIGGGVWSEHGDVLSGLVDEVFVYGRELKQTEIKQLFGN